jgi:hypothetical protein
MNNDDLMDRINARGVEDEVLIERLRELVGHDK